jgi:membrane-bound metal-dependent hydrolase YbcI (DUF457 family)
LSGYRTHLGGAAIALLLVLFVVGLGWQLSAREIAACIVIALLAGLWPDVDTKSVGQLIFYTLFFALDLWLIIHQRYKAAAFFGLVILLPILGRHRGFTHSRWTAVLLPCALYGVYLYYRGGFEPRTLSFLLAGICGYFSHLALDRKLI